MSTQNLNLSKLQTFIATLRHTALNDLILNPTMPKSEIWRREEKENCRNTHFHCNGTSRYNADADPTARHIKVRSLI